MSEYTTETVSMYKTQHKVSEGAFSNSQIAEEVKGLSQKERHEVFMKNLRALIMEGNELCQSLDEIIAKLEQGKFNNLTYVGKNYSKQDLIDDLKKFLDNFRINCKDELHSEFEVNQ